MKDPHRIPEAVRGYVYTAKFPPTVIDLFLHSDAAQQVDLRVVLERLANTRASKDLISNMLQRLQGDEKPADRLAEIRTLAAVGSYHQKPDPDAVRALKDLVEKAPVEQQVAAAFALQTITRGNIQAVPYLQGKVHDSEGKPLDVIGIQNLISAEKEATFGEAR